MEITPSRFTSYSPPKVIHNWHMAKEFVCPTSSLLETSISQPLYGHSSGLPEDICTASVSSDIEQSLILSQMHLLPQLCSTKDGSMRLQMFFSKSRPEHISQAIGVLRPSLAGLLLDPYANYAIQSLFQNCSSSQRLLLLEELRPELVSVACHPKGTHALQTLINLCSTQKEEAIYAQAFKQKVLDLSLHQNASHVIQKLLSTVKNRHFFIKELIGSAKRLATDKLGLCVIKKALNDPQIFAQLTEDLLQLMQDPYGNYAIQILVDQWMEEISFNVRCAIKGRTAQLCIQKYASNVIEKCLKDHELRRFVLSELSSEGKLGVLLGSPYGCYVLRTAIKLSSGSEKEGLKTAIVEAMKGLGHTNFKNRWDEVLAYLD